MINYVNVVCDHAVVKTCVLLVSFGERIRKPWGPFLESPGNVSGPKLNFQIEI